MVGPADKTVEAAPGGQELADATAKLGALDLQTLPPAVQERVQSLKALEDKRAELEKKYHDEQRALAAKYRPLYASVYDERATIVKGDANDTGDVVGVPDFWLQVLKQNALVSTMITEEDEPALKHLQDVKAIDRDDMTGFKLEFYFRPNEYFENTVLTKEYVIPNMIEGGEPMLENVTGTAINWKPTKNLTEKEVTRKQKKKGSNATRVVKKTVPCESFFNFFTAPELPTGEEDMDEDDEELLMSQIDSDFEMAQAFRDRIVPHAVSYFTGEMDDEEDDEDYAYEEGEDEEDDEDEDDDEEDDEEDKPKAAGSHPAGAPGQDGQAPECKNQ